MNPCCIYLQPGEKHSSNEMNFFNPQLLSTTYNVRWLGTSVYQISAHSYILSLFLLTCQEVKPLPNALKTDLENEALSH